MKKSRKYMLLTIMLIVIIILSINGVSLAKYTAEKAWNYYIKTQGFYFDSPNLYDNNKNNFWDGGSTHFTLTNTENDKVTSFDINYVVTCTMGSSTSSCSLNGTGKNTFSGTLSSQNLCVNYKDEVDVSSYDADNCLDNGYVYEHQITNKDIYFDIINPDVNNVVNIEIKTTAPYKKTIKTTYNLKKSESINGSIENKYSKYSNYNELVVSNTYSEEKCVDIIYKNNELNFILSEDDIINKSGEESTISVIIPALSSKKYTVFENQESITPIETKESFTCK